MKGNKVHIKKTETLHSPSLSSATIQDLFKNKNWKNLFDSVDISSIVFFRILFGLLMFYEFFRYLTGNWIAQYWIEPQYHLTYWPFDFLKPLPGNGMYEFFYFMAFLSFCIAIGFFYRISMILFFLGFSYIFLLEQTRYMNHFYLVMLISFVMIFVPANTSFSVDSKIFKKIYSEIIPAWALWLMRFMIAVPYFFGGIAKINTDWLQGQPLKIWLSGKSDFPVIGSLFQYDWMIYFMSYSGLFLDLLIVPALLFKKTRIPGFLIIALFHLMNSNLFSIGIFPWFMIAATSLFFNPDWLRKIINYLSGNSWKITFVPTIDSTQNNLSSKQKITIALLITWVLIQSILPMRHFFIKGSVHWTEEGHRYAWHMKLRTKKSMGTYKVIEKNTGITQYIDPLNYLTKRQYSKMGDRPYLIWKFCQIIKNDFKEKGKDVAVYANVKASLNGRKYQQLIDSTVDLTSVSRPIFPVKWIIPLHTPLNDQLVSDDGEDGGE